MANPGDNSILDNIEHNSLSADDILSRRDVLYGQALAWAQRENPNLRPEDYETAAEGYLLDLVLPGQEARLTAGLRKKSA